MSANSVRSLGWWLFASLVIVGIGVALRFAELREFPPALYPDEAFYGNAALRGLASGQFQLYYPEGHSGEGLLVWLNAPFIAAFGTQPWVLRVQPALVGSLSLLAITGCGYEFARSFLRAPPVGAFSAKASVALFSAFFLSLSVWHVHLSRLGVRAIYVPFFTILVLWTWLAARRRESSLLYLLCGVLTGLSLYTYPSARSIPILVVALFCLDFLPKGMIRRTALAEEPRRFRWIDFGAWSLGCTAIVAPLIRYYLTHADEFLSRYNEISFTSTGSPALQLLRSTARTGQSLFFFGDGNWRHNVSDAPLLHPFVAMLLLAGLTGGLIGFFRKGGDSAPVRPFGTIVLILALVIMSIPAIVTVEGIPHALRSSGMLAPIVIFAAIGASLLLGRLWLLVGSGPLSRGSTITAISFAALMLAQSSAYEYFWLWGPNPKTRYAFYGDLTDMANAIDRLPNAVPKYVVTDEAGPADLADMIQPIAFITNTATPETRQRRHLSYLTVRALHASTTPDDHGIYFLIQGARAEHEWLHQRAPNAEIHELAKTRSELNDLAMKD